MTTEEIIEEIDTEIQRLVHARNVLIGTSNGSAHRMMPTPAKKGAPKKRHLSAEARARIAEAQRKRWAKQKKG